MRISDWSSDVCSSDLTVTVTVPAGFAVTGLAGGDQIGDTITWTVTGGSLDVELQVVADDPLTVEQPVSWHAEAKAVEQVTDQECDLDNNEASAQASDEVTLDPALPPEVAVSLQGEALCIKEDGSDSFTVTASAQGDDFVSQILVENLPGVGEGWTVSIVGSDGGSFSSTTGLYTTSGSPASVTLTVTLDRKSTRLNSSH